ncbi:hypothetical protein [Ferrimonas pelagia]|uniref:H-NS histone family protein n=1 Tax=Ferrimonas pelagia TaxID=1177826 RepID=A0ABP9FJH8_9GAMM
MSKDDLIGAVQALIDHEDKAKKIAELERKLLEAKAELKTRGIRIRSLSGNLTQSREATKRAKADASTQRQHRMHAATKLSQLQRGLRVKRIDTAAVLKAGWLPDSQYQHTTL